MVRAPKRRMFISNSSCIPLISNTPQHLAQRETYAEDLDGTLHTVLAVRAERVEERAANTDGLCAESERLEDVARAADTTVDEDLELGVGVVALGLEGGDDLDEDLETGARGIELATTVVGEDDALHAGLVREDGVLGGGDTLEDDRHCGRG